MGLGKFPGWLKGGILLALIYIVLITVLSLIGDANLIIAIISPGLWIMDSLHLKLSAQLDNFLFIAISIVGWFIIGSLIGFAIGKVKGKKVK
jgi:hypothetical protein